MFPSTKGGKVGGPGTFPSTKGGKGMQGKGKSPYGMKGKGKSPYGGMKGQGPNFPAPPTTYSPSLGAGGGGPTNTEKQQKFFDEIDVKLSVGMFFISWHL